MDNIVTPSQKRPEDNYRMIAFILIFGLLVLGLILVTFL